MSGDGDPEASVQPGESAAKSDTPASGDDIGELARQPTVPIDESLREAGRAFISAAFNTLTEERVIPTSIYYPFIALARDYYGGSIMAADFHRLESILNEIYADRFSRADSNGLSEFASTYVFSFLEACVARCSQIDSFELDDAIVDECIAELAQVLQSPDYEMVCARHVSHLTTAGGGELQIGDVTVVPDSKGFGALVDRVKHEISGAAQAWGREEPRPHIPPHALLIVRERVGNPNPYEEENILSRRLGRFLLLSRLLTGGTVQSTFQVTGMTTLISCMDPHFSSFEYAPTGPLVRRTVRLTGRENAAFAALDELINQANVKRDGMITTSFDLGLSRFDRSYSTTGQWEQLVDLATALEASLIGDQKETEGLTLRLRSRAAALLATDEDQSSVIFADLGKLYGLRSSIVHGGQIKESRLRSILRAISTVPDNAIGLGVALAYAVDRTRDLVRRAILARLCLSAGPKPLWPLDGETQVDEILADEHARVAWRVRWHTRLTECDAGYAIGPSRAAVDFLSPED